MINTFTASNSKIVIQLGWCQSEQTWKHSLRIIRTCGLVVVLSLRASIFFDAVALIVGIVIGAGWRLR